MSGELLLDVLNLVFGGCLMIQFFNIITFVGFNYVFDIFTEEGELILLLL